MTTRPELQGSFGMVASTHWLASAAGMSVLERGGNAFDAAVAAGFVLQIVEPHLNGPGGDLPVVLWSAADGSAHVVCGQGTAPAAASLGHFSDLGLTLVPGSGPLAAVVPGAFGGWTLMLERWGTWELADVLAFALHYAESGFPVLPAISRTVTAVRELFTEHWQPSANAWLDGGQPPQPGSWWRSPAVAATYRRILAEAVGTTREQRIRAARDAWYRRFVAEEIEAFCRTAWRDTSGRDHTGLLTAEDLARWQPSVEQPVVTPYAGRYQLLKTGPWGQGPVVGQQLRMLDALGLPAETPLSGRWIHLITEAAKLGYADREAWYGDPLASNIPLATLLSDGYAAERAALVGEQADLQLRPGSPDGRQPRLATLPAAGSPAPGIGEPTMGSSEPARGSEPGRGSEPAGSEPTPGPLGQQRGDTCHLDVADRWGNLVSATPSGGWLQSSPVIAALGFPLGTRGQMFYLEPDLPNSLRPGARPRTTLSPSLALRDGEPWLAFGTPGGDQQDQWQLAFFTALVAAGDRANLQAVIDAPMFHTTHFPSSFYPREAHPGELVIEDRVPETVLAELRERGHRLTLSGGWTLGRLSAVAREGNILRAAANPRGAQGYAAGR
ncbi:MAG: gamma-glutamyltranspeptidase / glutathione hydrolase [Blastocatellia bacterium]|jgi:gamma-glutamyltranspeptidase/glutathione hydrolase|nr:gamma-glutamyltranspeptidase / glutathione hydrolase [Blastocatellia bacterium]